ncbi:MAG: DUF1847 domain-containing protein [Bacteroidota bacterium]
MDCLNCENKICRKEQGSCSDVIFNKEYIRQMYQINENKSVIESAAQLVDNGRAGTLSRIAEIVEFAKLMNYKKIGLAYCYGMERDAKNLQAIFAELGLNIIGISCSVGGLQQSEVNAKSCIHKVSCNPLGQAEQLNTEDVDLTIVMGICLGHDILLTRNLTMDSTTLVVKDRVFNHNPLKFLEK